ncbi:hypothetical protein [Micromonospora sp. NPDC048839]
MFVTLKAFTLSGEQVAERDLGRFSHSAELSGLTSIKPGEGEIDADLRKAVSETGATDVMVAYTSIDVRPSMVDPPHVVFFEAEWANQPFAGRYNLEAGTWPTRPGEVVVTRSPDLAPVIGAAMPVLAGGEQFKVVGIAEDRYARFSSFLAAPGTWAAMRPELLAAFPSMEASAAVYWGRGDRYHVTAAISARLAAREGADEASVVEAVAAKTRSAQEIMGEPEASWIDRVPAAYLAPSLTVPLLAVLLVFALNDRRFRRTLLTLISVGVRPSQAVVSVALAACTSAIFAALAGVVFGLALGVGARQIVQRFWDQPISPMAFPVDPALRVILMTLLGTAFSAVALRTALRAKRQATKTDLATGKRRGTIRMRTRDLRHVAAIVAGCGAVLQSARLASSADAMTLAATMTVAVLLVAPDMVGWALRRLPRRGPRSRLGRQQLLNDKRRATIAVLVFATGLGVPLGFLTLLDTMLVTADAGIYPDVAPGQIAVAGRGGFLKPPPEAVVAAANKDLPADQPVTQLRYAYSDDTSVSLAESSWGFIMAIDTPDQLGSLMNRRLSTAEAATLQRGGLLVWEEPRQPTYHVLIQKEGEAARRSDPIPVTAAPLNSVAWKQSIVGVLLTSTAQRQRLPLSAGALFYTGVSADQAAAARDNVLAAGLDPTNVMIYEDPRSAVAPAAFYAGAAGLLLLLLLTSIAVARTQVASLRSYLGTLITIGLTPKWAKQVLVLQQLSILGLSVVLALTIAVPPVIVSAWKLSGFVFSIPWSWLTAVTVAFIAAAIISTLFSTSRLRAADRATV